MLESLIYDWNQIGAPAIPKRVMLDDETLRDGLQSPSVKTSRSSAWLGRLSIRA